MTDRTDLMLEILKDLQRRMAILEDGQQSMQQQLNSLRGQVGALHTDVANIYGVLTKHDARLGRIERRLDIVGDAAE